MKKMKDKTCIIPKCDKEIYDDKSRFCGEHKRIKKSLDKKVELAGKYLLGIAILPLAKGAFDKITKK